MFVQQALVAGHSLHVYTRKKDGIPVSNRINLFIGELSDAEKIRQAIKGTDAAVSMLGPQLKFTYPGMPVADGHRHIISALKAEGVSRFITIATPSVKFQNDKASLATIVPGIMARIIFPKPYKEIVTIGEMIKASALNWTVIRFIAPVDAPAKGNTKVTFGASRISFSIPRTDIATFILKELDRNEYIRSMPIIGT